MYESNCSLLSESAVQEPQSEESDFEENNIKIAVMFLDLETAGFGMNADILQLAAKFGKKSFATYVKLVYPIPPQATAIHELTNCCGDLMQNGVMSYRQFQLELFFPNFQTGYKNLRRNVALLHTI